MRARGWLAVLVVCLALGCAVAWLARGWWLAGLGGRLVRVDALAGMAADAVAVPAADYVRAGVPLETLEEALRLRGRGRMLMSCPDWYGVSECALAESALKKRGYPGARLEWLRTARLPDEEEAEAVIGRLRQDGMGSAIILLPNYKTRRLGGLYKKLGQRAGVGVRVAAAPGADFQPERWWQSREGQKRFAEEVLRWLGVF